MTPAYPPYTQRAGLTPPPCAAEAPWPPGATGRCLPRRRTHFQKPDLGAAASLRASIPAEPAAGSSSGLLQRLQRAGGLPIDCPSSPGRSAAADRAAGHALPARRRSCETLGRRRLHRVVPSNHATSGSRGPWQVEPRPHAEGAATGPHRARPRACRVYVFVHGDKTKPIRRYYSTRECVSTHVRRWKTLLKRRRSTRYVVEWQLL